MQQSCEFKGMSHFCCLIALLPVVPFIATAKGVGGVGDVVGVVGVGVWGCVGVGVWGWFPLAFEHSKVCTLCDFGHLQFYIFLNIFTREYM
jgi:hypothetical protein